MSGNLAPPQRMFDEAESAGEDPDRCSGGRWMTAMLSGEFAAAWQQSDALPQPECAGPTSLLGRNQPRWQARHRAVSARVWRCGPNATLRCQSLPQRRQSVVWEVAPRLVELARCFDGVEQVITWGEAGSRDLRPCTTRRLRF